MSFLLSTASLYVSSMYRLSNHPLPTGGKLKTEEGKASLAPVNSKLALLSFFASVLRLKGKRRGQRQLVVQFQSQEGINAP